MNREIHVKIDRETCIGCGACVAICPHDTLTMVNDKAEVTGEDSLSCGHCMAVCPTGSITISGYRKMTEGFQTFTPPEALSKPGEFDEGELVRLMASRRSCREYEEKPVPMEVMEDLIRAGITAPSGTNAQLWNFTLLPDRKSVEGFSLKVLNFFRKLNKLARVTPLRGFLKLIGKPELSNYYRDYHDRIEEGISCWEEKGWDRLFHGAPAAILVSCDHEASCGAEDALLATGQILLTAHAMGLATCLVGFAVSALANEKSLKRAVQVPENETVHAVIALGWSKEKYRAPSVRKPVQPRVVHVS